MLPLLQDTPDTVNYLLAGYAILIGLLVLYVASWAVRRRNLQKDLELIDSLKAEKTDGDGQA
jgi:hypothetical protein